MDAIVVGRDARGVRNRIIPVARARDVVAQILVKLRRAHSKGLLNGLFDPHVPVVRKVKVGRNLGQ